MATPAPVVDDFPTDISSQLEGVTLGLLHWLRTDSPEFLLSLTADVVLFVVLYGFNRLLGHWFGRGHLITSWRGFARRMQKQTSNLFLGVLAVKIVSTVLRPPDSVHGAVSIVFTIAMAIQMAIWIRTLILAVVERHAATSGEDAEALASAMGIITVLVNVVIWVIALIVVLDNIGVNVTALVAGLGVGGIAIGLAAQGIFSDLFAALSILFDRPFRAGDTISFGTTTGVVEAIGLKTTRIRALSGEQVIVSNKNLLDLQISNLRRIETRRAVMTLNLSLGTTSTLLAKVPAMAKAAIAGRKHCRFERAHITRATLDAVEVEIVFHTDVPEYEVFMTARQEVTLALIAQFNDAGIQLAERIPVSA
jgi:small-conductance mechanosensitive channel